jgi:hypothetical protein
MVMIVRIMHMRVVDMRVINVRGRLSVLLALVAVPIRSDHNGSGRGVNLNGGRVGVVMVGIVCLVAVRNRGNGSGGGRAGLVAVLLLRTVLPLGTVLLLGTMAALLLVLVLTMMVMGLILTVMVMGLILTVMVVGLITKGIMIIPRSVGTPRALLSGLRARCAGP